MIEMTVALPMFKAGKIAEVTLESLCAQKEINFEWELIVIEERKVANNPLVFGRNKLMKYRERLAKIGCKRIKYISIDKWIPLSHKWIDIYENSSESSKAFMLQAADCWAHSLRLAVSFQKIVKEGFDWYQQEKGYFYDIGNNAMAIFDSRNTVSYHPCSVNMTIRKELLGILEKEGVDHFIDSWMYNRIRPKKVFDDQILYEDGLDINGHNIISHNRGKLITEVKAPFIKTDKKLEDIIPNKKIIDILRNSREKLPAINTRFPDVTTVVLWHREEKIFLGAMSSASGQVYPGVHKSKFLDNRKNEFTIPQGFNKLVEECDTEYINFLGDDDKLSKEMVLCLMMAIEAAIRHNHKNPVCAVSNMTLIDAVGNKSPMPIWGISPGMWKTEWLRKHPFDEKVTDHVTYNYHKTMQDKFGIVPIHAYWNFGYFYYQGKDNLSGNKFETITEESDGNK